MAADSNTIGKITSMVMMCVVSLIMMAFAITQIVRAQNSELWVAVLASVVGIWLPSPISLIPQKAVGATPVTAAV